MSFITFLAVFLMILFQVLSKTGIESEEDFKGFWGHLTLALEHSLKTSTMLSVNVKMKSLTYKITLIFISIYGFVVLSYYEAYLGSGFIVKNTNQPYQTWNDVAESEMNLLVKHDSLFERYFKDSSNEVLRGIYEDKIATSPSLVDVGFKESISMIKSGQFIAYDNLRAYSKFDEYPCQIVSSKSIELRYFHTINKIKYSTNFVVMC